MSNKFKNKVEEQVESEIPKSRPVFSPKGFLRGEFILQHINFIMFCIFLAICYITNSYYAERTVRDIAKLEQELKDLRAEYITTKSKLMFRSKQSQLVADVKVLGMIESTTPPHKLELDKSDYKKYRLEP